MLCPAKIPWLELALTPCIGAVFARRLLDKFGTAENIFKAKLDDLISVEGISPRIALNITRRLGKPFLDNQLKLIEKNHIDILVCEDESYPVNLKVIYGRPIILFVRGKVLPDDYFSVAIVGTRMCSFYGRQMSEKLSAELVEKGITIISGGARGIDTCAHRSALKIGGRTIAVLGCGVDVAYPSENRDLFEEIARSGALISEFPLGARPDKGNFPMRNRIISGLSLGVVVIEAPLKSGSLITVRHALDQGREVFSVPHEAGKFASLGTNQLLRDGAKLVENADDIMEELSEVIRCKIIQLKNKTNPKQEIAQGYNNFDSESAEGKVFSLLSDQPVHIEEIIASSNMGVDSIFNILTRLELKRMVRQLPGKQFIRT